MPDPSSPRFVRQVALPGFGPSGQERLAAARVVVVGAGGLGCALLPVLAASGIGVLVVVDDDRIEESNLHRQTLFGPGDVGEGKAEVAAVRLGALGATAVAVPERLTADSAAHVIAGATLVVDATDDVDARYALDDAAAAAGVPLVWGSAVGTSGQVGAVVPGSPRWRDLFPVRPAADQVAVCAVAGVLPSLCTTVGGLMATEVLKVVSGLGRPLAGRLLVVDAAAATVREIAYGAADGSAGPQQEEERVSDVEEIPPAEAAGRLAATDAQLLDVREAWEVETAALPGATVIPLGELPARLGELDRDRPVIAVCHHGVRSLRAAEGLADAGFEAASVSGGIDAWSRDVDPSIPRY